MEPYHNEVDSFFFIIEKGGIDQYVDYISICWLIISIDDIISESKD